MSSISTPAEIVAAETLTAAEDPDLFPESEPYSELLLETLEAAERVAEEPVDVHSSMSADSLFTDLLENWQ